MSASGQGDEIVEISKDDVTQISSTTCDNGNKKPSAGENAQSDPETVPETTAESSEAVKDYKPVKATTVEVPDDKSDVDPNNPSTTTNLMAVDGIIPDITPPVELLDEAHETKPMRDMEIGHCDPNLATSSEAVSIVVTAREDILNVEKTDKDSKAEIADTDSSSIDEDLELRWEDDCNEEIDETVSTDDVLKLLDKELGIDDTSEKAQETDYQNKTEASIKKLESITGTDNDPNKTTDSINKLLSSEDSIIHHFDKNNDDLSSNHDFDESQLLDRQSDKSNKDAKTLHETDFVLTASDSFEESLKIIQKIDILTKDSNEDVENQKAMGTYSTETIEKPKITNQIVSFEMETNVSTDENLTESLKPDTTSETQLKSSLKTDVEEMDTEISFEDNRKEPLTVDNPVVSVENTKLDEIMREVESTEDVKETVSLKESININEDTVKKVSEIDSLKDSENSNKGNKNIKINVSNVSEADNNQILTAADISSIGMNVVTAEASDIDKVQEVKDNQTIIVPSEVPNMQQLEPIKDTLRNDDKNKNEINDPEIINDVQKIQNQSGIDVVQEIKVKKEIDDEEKNQAENVSFIEDSVLDTTITPNIHHRINQPNVMLDIPTQELSDIEAELGEFDSELDESIEKTQESLKTDIIIACTAKSDVTECLAKGKVSEVLQTVTETNITVTSTPKSNKIRSPTIEIGATTTLLNMSPTRKDLPSSITMHVDAKEPSTSKYDDYTPSSSIKMLEKVNEHLSTSTEMQDHEKASTSTEMQVDERSSKSIEMQDDEKASTSKSLQNDDAQPSTSTEMQVDEEASTSKSLQNDDAQPSTEMQVDEEASTSKSIHNDDAQPSTSTEMQDDEKASTSKSIQNDDAQPSTSTEMQGDEKASTSKLNVDAQPSTSNFKLEIGDEKLLPSEKLTPDNADDIQEITDSLGLLAESCRVMDDENDDDDDAEDPEADENDDDDDFDPYEESSSQMLEDMEESNTPPPELDPKDVDKPGPSPKVQESDEGTLDIADGTMDIADDIECVENELPELDIPDDTVSETPSSEGKGDKDEPEIIDADEHTDTQSVKIHPPEKIINILEKVFGQKIKDLRNQPSSAPAGKILNYVEVEGSSDSDDVLEVSKSDVSKESDVISVNIPEGVEVMSTSGPRGTSEILSKKGEVIISGVPKPPPHKMSKLDTSQVTIKTRSKASPTINIPEATSLVDKALKDEIFNLDSDEEVEKKVLPESEENVPEDEETPKNMERKCINPQCTNENRTYYQADRATVAYYSLNRRSGAVCEPCSRRARERSEALIKGIKDLRPFLELEMDSPSQQLVEISDSDSDEEAGDDSDCIGEKAAEFLEGNFADMINETWVKYQLESRLKETETILMNELEKIEADAKEINAMLDECQKKTDAVRLDFYKDYEPRRKSLNAIIIHDTPFSSYSHTEKDLEELLPDQTGSRYPKRRAASIASDTPAKKPAIPMGYTPLGYTSLDGKTESTAGGLGDQSKTDDDKEEISVVKLSAESAPASLPPCGEIVRPPLKNGMATYAMRNAFGTWLKGKIMEVQPKTAGQQFTQCRVKFEHKIKNPCKVLAARCLAYPEPCEVRMTIGTRVIALFKDPQNTARRDSFYSGVVAEIPNPVNNYRYLVFFDDGYAQYVHHQDTRVVCESSSLVWEEVHPFIRDFICNYLLSYPERPMVRLHAGEKLKTEWNGKWWDSKVLQVDASIALIHFDEDNRTEWIYRGSTRLAPLYLELQAAVKAGEGKTRSRLPRSKAQMRSNMPCVEYTRSDGQAATKPIAETQQHNEELRRQRSVAKKSTTQTAHAPTVIQGTTPFEGVISRVVYYTPKNAVKPYKFTSHTCTLKCKRTDLLSLTELRTYNPLAKPLLSGWERQTVRYKSHKVVTYRAPCGRRLRNMPELHRYLRILQSDLSVDLFDFTPGTHCLAEFVLNKCIVGKKDLSHGKENVPVPCVNYYDDSLPEFCSYNTERTPTAGVPLNIDPDFLCGCDCTDDCMDKSKCACWKMTLEGARTIGQEGPNVGYEYRRLPEPLPSGIYECNSRCKCKQTCLNRVAQHPLQLKLQVFKTINRGWGIRALNDVPKGSFLCVYAGNLLTDATANLDGLNEGDEYLAELDYIEVVEGMKEGYEDDIPDADKKLDKKSKGRSSESESELSSESEDEREQSSKDDDFQPGYIPHSNVTFKKSLRKREKAKKKEENEKHREEVKKGDDCITISDDEEVREPSRFTAQAGMVDKDLISKHSSRVSVRTLFGKDEACYIMDAKVQGNIGRYLNHSCHPNVFVQNVFVDTHDPRFPWVAFFALSHVRAGTELTWNYNYDIGSVPGKVLYCYCGAPNCRGRLL